jgi:hypothetical protein
MMSTGQMVRALGNEGEAPSLPTGFEACEGETATISDFDFAPFLFEMIVEPQTIIEAPTTVHDRVP